MAQPAAGMQPAEESAEDSYAAEQSTSAQEAVPATGTPGGNDADAAGTSSDTQHQPADSTQQDTTITAAATSPADLDDTSGAADAAAETAAAAPQAAPPEAQGATGSSSNNNSSNSSKLKKAQPPASKRPAAAPSRRHPAGSHVSSSAARAPATAAQQQASQPLLSARSAGAFAQAAHHAPSAAHQSARATPRPGWNDSFPFQDKSSAKVISPRGIGMIKAATKPAQPASSGSNLAAPSKVPRLNLSGVQPPGAAAEASSARSATSTARGSKAAAGGGRTARTAKGASSAALAGLAGLSAADTASLNRTIHLFTTGFHRAMRDLLAYSNTPAQEVLPAAWQAYWEAWEAERVAKFPGQSWQLPKTPASGATAE